MSLFYTNETNTLKNHKEKVGDIMTSLKSINRRVGSLFGVAAFVLATVTPGLLPAFASAAQITERSVELSNSSKTTTAVTYTIDFTPAEAAGAVVLNFCSNSPLIGSACTAPTGFDATGASATGYTKTLTSDATTNTLKNAIVLTGSISAAATTIDLTGVTNPSAAGPLYVRIVTYDTQAHAEAYLPATLGADAQDSGSAAVSITDTVAVSAAVLESMTFCVSGAAITTGSCGGSLTAPTVKLGEGSGNTLALSSGAVSEGSIYSQISTNAQDGAVVNLKSSATGCGGLIRAGDTGACDIAPALAGGITQGQAKFGVKVAPATDPSTTASPSGTFRAYGDTPYYSDSVFKLNFVDGTTGITSTYGDNFLDTDGAPVSDKNVQITFGASVSNNTPAGLYSADFSLIATGKF